MKARNKILVRFINKTGTRAFQKMYQGIRVQKSFNLKHCLPPPYCSRDGLIVKSGREWGVHLRLGPSWNHSSGRILETIGSKPGLLPSQGAFRETESRKSKRASHQPVTTLETLPSEATPIFLNPIVFKANKTPNLY